LIDRVGDDVGNLYSIRAPAGRILLRQAIIRLDESRLSNALWLAFRWPTILWALQPPRYRFRRRVGILYIILALGTARCFKLLKNIS
jgi:hypothetical protein